MKKLPLARSNDIVVQSTGKEMLIYDLQVDRIICLNPTATSVYLNCDGKMPVDDFKHQNALSDEVILLAIDKLYEHKLLEPETVPASFLKGLNRRELIKKIGLSSAAVLLPTVLTAIAPMAAHAASGAVNCGTPGLTACTTVAECASGETCQNNCCITAAGQPIDGGGSTAGGGTGIGGCQNIFGC